MIAEVDEALYLQSVGELTRIGNWVATTHFLEKKKIRIVHRVNILTLNVHPNTFLGIH